MHTVTSTINIAKKTVKNLNILLQTVKYQQLQRHANKIKSETFHTKENAEWKYSSKPELSLDEQRGEKERERKTELPTKLRTMANLRKQKCQNTFTFALCVCVCAKSCLGAKFKSTHGIYGRQ